jgi:hypothetical protein
MAIQLSRIIQDQLNTMDLCELTPTQMKIEKLIRGKARTSSSLVVCDYTKFCFGCMDLCELPTNQTKLSSGS